MHAEPECNSIIFRNVADVDGHYFCSNVLTALPPWAASRFLLIDEIESSIESSWYKKLDMNAATEQTPSADEEKS